MYLVSSAVSLLVLIDLIVKVRYIDILKIQESKVFLKIAIQY